MEINEAFIGKVLYATNEFYEDKTEELEEEK